MSKGKCKKIISVTSVILFISFFHLTSVLAYAPNLYYFGDINMDGKVNSADSSLIDKYLKKQLYVAKQNIYLADANLDGSVDEDDILYINGENTYYLIGDINKDKAIDEKDLEKLLSEKESLTAEEKLLGDINRDKQITDDDYNLLNDYIFFEEPYTINFYPYYIGDVNLDDVLTFDDAQLIAKKSINDESINFSRLQSYLADVDGDKQITLTDSTHLTRSKNFQAICLDETLCKELDFSSESQNGTIKNYRLGDANLDGEINEDDAIYIANISIGKVKLAEDSLSKITADVDADGNIFITDSVLIGHYIYNLTSTAVTKEQTVKVAFETDGGSEILAQTLTVNDLIEKPSNPTKEGYTFSGWYTDKERQKEYNFDDKVKTNMILYAKWTKTNAGGAEEVPENPNTGGLVFTGISLIVLIGLITFVSYKKLNKKNHIIKL